MGGRGASGIGNTISFSNSVQIPSFFGEFEGATAKWADDLKAEERESIYSYTSIGFRDVNNLLRKDRDPLFSTRQEVDAMISNLDSALGKASLAQDIVVYRGLGKNFFGGDYSASEINDVFAGHALTDKGYWSTTLLREDLPRFAKEKKYILALKVPKGKGRGQWIAPLSAHRRENEFLIARGSSYRIIGAREENGKVIVDAELIAR